MSLQLGHVLAATACLCSTWSLESDGAAWRYDSASAGTAGIKGSLTFSPGTCTVKTQTAGALRHVFLSLDVEWVSIWAHWCKCCCSRTTVNGLQLPPPLLAKRGKGISLFPLPQGSQFCDMVYVPELSLWESGRDWTTVESTFLLVPSPSLADFTSLQVSANDHLLSWSHAPEPLSSALP